MIRSTLYKVPAIINLVGAVLLLYLSFDELSDSSASKEGVSIIGFIATLVCILVYGINDIVGLQIVRKISKYQHTGRSLRIGLLVMFPLLCIIQAFVAFLLYFYGTTVTTPNGEFSNADTSIWLIVFFDFVLLFLTAIVQMIFTFPLLRLSQHSNEMTKDLVELGEDTN